MILNHIILLCIYTVTTALCIHGIEISDEAIYWFGIATSILLFVVQVTIILQTIRQTLFKDNQS
jgi:hypothetical protein